MDKEFRLKAINVEDIIKVKNRDPKYLEADKSFVKTLAQAAMNVELFTIPLYMTSMYSIVGMHQINSKGSDFYQGRWWPGSGPNANPSVQTPKNESIANKMAFNNIFSVFMEEMLHLQLASNIAARIGKEPDFDSPALVDTKDYKWVCYGTETTPSKVIPHIIDLSDCIAPYNEINVELDALNENQINLFITIEETLQKAQERIAPENRYKYEHQAPYNDWKVTDTENDLPLFGSIGKMYETLWVYIEIVYSDGTSLLAELAKEAQYQQRDRFNTMNASHPMAEYPGMKAELSTENNLQAIKAEMINMIDGITDQGEGNGVVEEIIKMWDVENYLLNARNKAKAMPKGHPHAKAMPANHPHMLKAVQVDFQPDKDALIEDYKGYTSDGNPIPISGQAKARIDTAKLDHYETFNQVKEIMKDSSFQTWDMWHKDGNRWSADMLQDDSVQTKYNIPSTQEVADSLNILKDENAEENYRLLSLAAVGTLKGLTMALGLYWKNQGNEFPSPAMGGSGDRISICWAITGKKPDLLMGIGNTNTSTTMYNACQGMSMMSGEVGKDTMPDVKIFHSCKGSNDCKTQGGCGFVQNSNGGSSCSGNVQLPTDTNTKSAPANNRCNTMGGCAVPISASQLFPQESAGATYQMQLFTYPDTAPFTTTPIKETMSYKVGDNVYDIAWEAFTTALKARGETNIPTKPKPHPLRLAFPPST